jgi:hypothetical protein
MKPVAAGWVLVLLVAVGAPGLRAEATKQVKVVFEFDQTATGSREAVQGSGRVTVTEAGRVRPWGRLEVESTRHEVRRTGGLFTIVQDGGESTLLVASQVPTPEVAYYRDYLTGAGHLAAGVAFRDIGTSLKVRARVLPDHQVQVRVTPTVSWLAGDRSGVVEIAEASTELIVPNDHPVVIGGATARLSELTRRILGSATSRSGSETRMTLTATVLE